MGVSSLPRKGTGCVVDHLEGERGNIRLSMEWSQLIKHQLVWNQWSPCVRYSSVWNGAHVYATHQHGMEPMYMFTLLISMEWSPHIPHIFFKCRCKHFKEVLP